MSIVTDHAKGAAVQSFSMIGTETVTIGNDSIACVLAEADRNKDYEDVGFREVVTLRAVCKTSDLPAESINKRSATARGLNYRVEGLSIGGTFTSFNLESKHKS